MLIYTREIKFDDKPDYGYLKKCIATICEEENFEMDLRFDWLENKGQLIKFIY